LVLVPFFLVASVATANAGEMDKGGHGMPKGGDTIIKHQTNNVDNSKTWNVDKSNTGEGGTGVGVGVGIAKSGDNNNHNSLNGGDQSLHNENTNVSEGGDANANSSSGATASSTGNTGNSLVNNSKYTYRNYGQPDVNLNTNDGYSLSNSNQFGTVAGTCPTSSSFFSGGAWLAGVSFGGNSDKLPKGCGTLVDLTKRSYNDGILGYSVEGLSKFDQVQAACVAKAYALKENYGYESSVAACITAATQVKTPHVPVVLPPLPPIKHIPAPPVVVPGGKLNG
jgi:hypothetical protein